MSNTLQHRIYDFLKDHPPFIYIPKSELLSISEKVKVLYYDAGKVIFSQGDIPSNVFYIVREGAVELYDNLNDTKRLVDVCDEGDIFGIRPIISESQVYTLTSLVSEESLIYSIPVAEFKRSTERNSEVADFFTTCFTAGIRNPYMKYSRFKAIIPSDSMLGTGSSFPEIQKISVKKDPVTCKPGSSIKEAANLMKIKNVGSIIITDDSNKPIGIFTDRDIRNKVATGLVSIDSPIDTIMSSPVITAGESLTVADSQINMLKNNIHHLCITADGTPNSGVIGIVSEHDVLVTYAQSPSVLIREIQRAQGIEELITISQHKSGLLKRYLLQEVSISFISKMINEINSAINIRVIELSIEELRNEGILIPEIKWCWLALGSQARQEQLINSDQDNALVFDDVHDSEYKEVQDVFLELARRINSKLKDCGLEYCPANMMAGNAEWCLSLSKWNDQFNRWIFAPGPKEVMYTNIFFDFVPVYGNYELAANMKSNILNSISSNETFLSFLAQNALQNPPPLSFFRSIMVEHDGVHKNEFDIKARAMMPMVDGARVLALSAGKLERTCTLSRFMMLAELEPANKDLYELLADEFELLLRLKTLQGLKHNTSGRFIKPDELNKMQRLMLRKSFEPIKELQSLLTIRFRLNIFR